MRFFFIKEGVSTPSLYSDVCESINNVDHEQLGFYTRMDFTFRLMRNRSLLQPELPFAIAHYHHNPTLLYPPDGYFLPIDFELAVKALDRYDFVTLASVSKDHFTKESQLLSSMRYISRNANGKFVDVTTDEVLYPDRDDVTFASSMITFLRLGKTQAYYVILNPSLLRASDGFDYHDEENDTLYKLVSQSDGSIRDEIFWPEVNNEYCTMVGNVIIQRTRYSELQIRFFCNPLSSTCNENRKQWMDNIKVTVDCPEWAHFILSDGTIKICNSGGLWTTRPLKISFDGGPGFAGMKQSEKLTFEYIIIRDEQSI